MLKKVRRKIKNKVHVDVNLGFYILFLFCSVSKHVDLAGSQSIFNLNV